LALIGGRELTDGCEPIDRALLAASGATTVHVLATAAAYEHPERAVATATAYYARLGVAVEEVHVLGRPDAFVEANVAAVRSARFLYFCGGSPLHLRSVLKDAPIWDAVVDAYQGGAVVAGSSAGAMVLCDPMTDPRGGAFTLGLGLHSPLAVIPHHDTWSAERSRRTIELARGFPLLTVDEATAAIRHPDGKWSVAGVGEVHVYRDGEDVGLAALG